MKIPIKKRHKDTKAEGTQFKTINNYIFLLCAFVPLCLCAFSHAETYKYIDQDGVMHFTDYPPPSLVNNIIPAKNQNNSSYNNTKPIDTLNDIQYSNIIKSYADKYGIDKHLIKAVIKAESDFKPYVISKKGAMGLMQLIPDTAKRYNVKNPFDPKQNIEGGVKYLSDLFEIFDGNINYILAAYNSGENTVIKYNGIPPYKETKDYVRKVVMYYNEYTKSYNNNNNNKDTIPQHIAYTNTDSNKIFKVITKDGTVIFTDFPYSSYLNRSSIEGVIAE